MRLMDSASKDFPPISLSTSISSEDVSPSQVAIHDSSKSKLTPNWFLLVTKSFSNAEKFGVVRPSDFMAMPVCNLRGCRGGNYERDNAQKGEKVNLASDYAVAR